MKIKNVALVLILSLISGVTLTFGITLFLFSCVLALIPNFNSSFKLNFSTILESYFSLIYFMGYYFTILALSPIVIILTTIFYFVYKPKFLKV